MSHCEAGTQQILSYHKSEMLGLPVHRPPHPDYDAEPELASYAYGQGHVLAGVHGPNIALCAEEPEVMSKRLARERGMELAERRGVRWLG